MLNTCMHSLEYLPRILVKTYISIIAQSLCWLPLSAYVILLAHSSFQNSCWSSNCSHCCSWEPSSYWCSFFFGFLKVLHSQTMRWIFIRITAQGTWTPSTLSAVKDYRYFILDTWIGFQGIYFRNRQHWFLDALCSLLFVEGCLQNISLIKPSKGGNAYSAMLI